MVHMRVVNLGGDIRKQMEETFRLVKVPIPQCKDTPLLAKYLHLEFYLSKSAKVLEVKSIPDTEWPLSGFLSYYWIIINDALHCEQYY